MSLENLSNAIDAQEEGRYPYKNMVSHFMFDKFIKCPKHWELRYKEKNYEPEDNEETFFGIVFHDLLEEYLIFKFSDQTSDFDLKKKIPLVMEEKYEEIRQRWEEEVDLTKRNFPYDTDVLKRTHQKLKTVFNSFFEVEGKFFDKDKYELFETEQELTGDTLYNLQFSGRADVILYDKKNDEFIIMDVKTADGGFKDPKLNKKSRKMQLLLYKYYFSLNTEISLNKIRTKFLLFNREGIEGEKIVKEEEINSSKKDIKWAIKSFGNFLQKVFNKNGFFLNKSYPKKPNKVNCKMCPYSTEFNGTGQCDQGGKFWNK